MYKKIIPVVLLFILSTAVYAQNWETISYKDVFSFQFPKGFTAKDTLGANMFQSETDDTTYMCNIMPDAEPMAFTSQESLDAFYTDYFTSLVSKAGKTENVKSEIKAFGKFRVLTGSFEHQVLSKKLRMEIWFMHINNLSISFQGITQNNSKARFDYILNSIRFNEKLGEQNQISNGEITLKADAPKNARTITMLYIAGGLVLLLGLAWFLFKPKKK